MKEDYVIVSFSGGKDSTAMLLHMIELGERIDEVLYCDVYKEFPAMYQHIEKVKQIVDNSGIKFTTLRAANDFDYLMFEAERTTKDVRGWGWALPYMRWCTGRLKTDVIRQYLSPMKKTYNIIQCVGIAADETKRLTRKPNQEKGKRYPLVEWGWSEADCLAYCYQRGFDWNGLYNHFKRVSCWCCPLQTLDSLRSLKKNYPELWEELKEMDKKSWNQFRADYSVEQLEKRFEFEEQKLQQGESIRSRAFYKELKELLGIA